MGHRPSFESARLVCVCSYNNNMQCKLLQVSFEPDLSVLVAIYWCLSKQTLFIKGPSVNF